MKTSDWTAALALIVSVASAAYAHLSWKVSRRAVEHSEFVTRTATREAVIGLAREIVAERDRIDRAVEDHKTRAAKRIREFQPAAKESAIGRHARLVFDKIAPLKAKSTPWSSRAEEILSQQASLLRTPIDDLKAIEIELSGYLSQMKTSSERIAWEIEHVVDHI